jgi:multimeric flavodoxin WrbA
VLALHEAAAPGAHRSALQPTDIAVVGEDDGFKPIAEKMAAAEGILFATPVYWYAMSAPLKIFFDRLTDMTENLKALGKQLAGKPV